MMVLGIDTATEMVSVALVDGDELVGAGESRSDRRHAEDLVPMIDFVTKRAGINLGDVEAIAVDVGPGLFTGMRVGIAAAQALAHVLSVPLVGVDGLEALVAATTHRTDHDLVVPTIDARRNEVAWSIHRVRDDGSTTRVAAPTVGTLDALALSLRERAQSALLLGQYAHSKRDALIEALGPQSWTISFGDSAHTFPHAKHVAAIAHSRLVRGDVFADDAVQDATEPDAHAPTVTALYLREADAEINWVSRGSS